MIATEDQPITIVMTRGCGHNLASSFRHGTAPKCSLTHLYSPTKFVSRCRNASDGFCTELAKEVRRPFCKEQWSYEARPTTQPKSMLWRILSCLTRIRAAGPNTKMRGQKEDGLPSSTARKLIHNHEAHRDRNTRYRQAATLK